MYSFVFFMIPHHHYLISSNKSYTIGRFNVKMWYNKYNSLLPAGERSYLLSPFC